MAATNRVILRDPPARLLKLVTDPRSTAGNAAVDVHDLAPSEELFYALPFQGTPRAVQRAKPQLGDHNG